MQKIKLDAIFINDKRQDGSPYMTKTGKPFSIAVIKWGDDKASKMVFDDNDPVLTWSQGDEVEVTFTEKDGYKNFDLPKQTDLLEQRVEKLEETVKKLVKYLKENK